MIKDVYGNARFYGVYRGVVASTQDPQGLGRLKLKVPQILANQETEWAWPVEKYGTSTVIPNVGQGVWTMFEGGDPSYPMWIGTFGGSTTAVETTDPVPNLVVSQPDEFDVPFTVVGGTLSTQPTFDGQPLFTGFYSKVGGMVHFTIDVDMDNITSFGSGQYYMNLPFPSKHNYQFAAGCLHDISTGTDYPIFGHVLAGQSQMVLKSIDAHANSAYNVAFTPTNPVTLAVADNFHISGNYIADEVI